MSGLLTATVDQGVPPVRAQRRVRGRGSVVFLWPAFLLVMAVATLPIAYAFYQSVHASKFLNVGVFVGLANFERFFSRGTGLWNSIVFTIGSVGLAVPLGVAAALALTRIERGRNVLRTLLIVPWLISNVVVAQLWGWLMNPQLGPVGHAVQQFGSTMPNPVNSDLWSMPLLVLVHTWTAFPLVMVMTYAALQTVPRETLEAATIDGATTLQQIFLVMLPLIRNTILITVLLTTINSLNNATLVLVLTGGGPGGATETLALQIFNEGLKFFRMGVAAAGSVVVFALNVVFAMVYFKVLEEERK